MRVKHFNLNLGTQIFKAFSDRSRVRILYLLYKKEELCVSDLELVLQFTQTKTSRHLIYLKNAGLVNSRKMDQWTFYSLKEELKEMTGLIFNYLDRDPELINDIETYRILYGGNELAICKLHKKRFSENS